MMKKLWICLSVIGCLCVGGCQQESPATPKPDASAEIPNPFVEYATLEEASQAVGFDVVVPEAIAGQSQSKIEVMDNTMIQVSYGDSIVVRKSAGDADISGDYNTYSEKNTTTVGDKEVTTKGEKGNVNVVTWTMDGYTYAVDASGAGISMDEMQVVVTIVQ